MGSHRVGHDWSNLAAAAAAMWLVDVEMISFAFFINQIAVIIGTFKKSYIYFINLFHWSLLNLPIKRYWIMSFKYQGYIMWNFHRDSEGRFYICSKFNIIWQLMFSSFLLIFCLLTVQNITLIIILTIYTCITF